MSAAHLLLGAARIFWWGSSAQRVRGIFLIELNQAVYPILAWFVVVSCFISLVVVRLVIVTAESYDLTQYSVQVLVRALVLELVPLFAALWVAVRYSLAGRSTAGASFDELSAKVAAGGMAILFFALLNCVLALMIAYLMLHGPSLWALAGYTHQVGKIFLPQVLVVLGVKTILFCCAVTLIPAADVIARRPEEGASGLRLLTHIFLALVLIEIIGLVAIYF